MNNIFFKTFVISAVFSMIGCIKPADTTTITNTNEPTRNCKVDVWDGEGVVKLTYEYNTSGKITKETEYVNFIWRDTTITNYVYTANTIASTNNNGKSSIYTLNSAGNPIKYINESNDTTFYTYNAAKQLIRQDFHRYVFNAKSVIYNTIVWDGAGNIVETRSFYPSGKQAVEVREYNTNISSKSAPNLSPFDYSNGNKNLAIKGMTTDTLGAVSTDLVTYELNTDKYVTKITRNGSFTYTISYVCP